MTGAELITAQHPYAGYPDQVFVNSKQIEQVGNKDDVGPGTFYVNASTDQLYVGDDPFSNTVEASDLEYGLTLRNAAGSVVRGMVFRRFATAVPNHAAVRGYSDDLVIENNHFIDNASAGLSIVGDRGHVISNTMRDNGKLGLHVDVAADLIVEYNYFTRNNAEHFLIESAEGGAKLTTVTRVSFRRNLSEGNYGRGIWFDVASWDNEILHNVVRNNDSNGIQYEISGNALIAGNWVYGNAWGVYVLESNKVDVWNNTLVRNSRDLYVLEGRRSSSDTRIPQHIGDITARNNILSLGDDTTKSLLGVQDANKQWTAEELGVSTDYNAYHRAVASTPKWVVTWANYPSGNLVFTTLDAFTAATGQEAHSVEVASASDPFFVDAANGDFHLRAGSPAAGKGVGLPSRVAYALGVAPGVPVDLGALGM
jgi:hypothetical protein